MRKYYVLSLLVCLCALATGTLTPSATFAYQANDQTPFSSSSFTSTCTNTSLVVWEDSEGIHYAVKEQDSGWVNGNLPMTSICGVHVEPLHMSDVVLLTVCTTSGLKVFYYRISSLQRDIGSTGDPQECDPFKDPLNLPKTPCVQEIKADGVGKPSPVDRNDAQFPSAFGSNYVSRVMYCGEFKTVQTTSNIARCLSWTIFRQLDHTIPFLTNLDVFNPYMLGISYNHSLLAYGDNEWIYEITNPFGFNVKTNINLKTGNHRTTRNNMPIYQPKLDQKLLYDNWRTVEGVNVKDKPYRTSATHIKESAAGGTYEIDVFNYTSLHISLFFPVTPYVIEYGAPVVSVNGKTDWKYRGILQVVQETSFDVYELDLARDARAIAPAFSARIIDNSNKHPLEFFCFLRAPADVELSATRPLGVLTSSNGLFVEVEAADVVYLNYYFYQQNEAFLVSGILVLSHTLETEISFTETPDSVLVANGGSVIAKRAVLNGTLVIRSDELKKNGPADGKFILLTAESYEGTFSAVEGCGVVIYQETSVLLDVAACEHGATEGASSLMPSAMATLGWCLIASNTLTFIISLRLF